MARVPRRRLSLSTLALLHAVPPLHAQPPSPEVRMVDVAGRAIPIQAAGLTARGPGAPVVAYDRRGLGESESDGERPSPEHAVRTLRALLRSAGIGPPYVLVGHSWGGPLVRMFAALHPDDVVGLVYLDAMDRDATPEDYRGPFTPAGGSEEELGRAREMPVPAMSIPAGARAEFEVVFELHGLRSDRLAAAFDALRRRPRCRSRW